MYTVLLTEVSENRHIAICQGLNNEQLREKIKTALTEHFDADVTLPDFSPIGILDSGSAYEVIEVKVDNTIGVYVTPITIERGWIY